MKRRRKEPDWSRLTPSAKAEILAGTLHQLTDHMPKVWSKVPKWLRSQIRQAIFDCGMMYDKMTKKEISMSVDYAEWLLEKFPPPGSAMARLLRKKRK